MKTIREHDIGSIRGNYRFKVFKAAMRRELGRDCSLLVSGEIMIHANEFTPMDKFHTLQAAIDRYHRYMPEGWE